MAMSSTPIRATGISADRVPVLRRARAECDPIMRRWVATLPDTRPDSLRRMAGYHLGWWDRAGQPAKRVAGKGFRAALAIAAAAACSRDGGAAAGAAAAVEFLHNFTLVHDDIMDSDRIRRTRPAAWCVWGVPKAILLGDALHGLAFRCAVTDCPDAAVSGVVSRLATAVTELCQGRYGDRALDGGTPIDVDRYLHTVSGKTGALMGCACAAGACCAGADSATVDALELFGRRVGLAFQITDDLLGLWGDPRVTGKPVGSDVRRRKHSLPVVAALGSPTQAGRELRRLYGSTAPLSAAEVLAATGLIEAAGGRRIAVQQARRQLRRAVVGLPDELAADDLVSLASAVEYREG
ncbi:polyprenyl synthetase family protein [Nocardia terpenica]|uniref:Polyprenyl synthetase family protein n=2 Tax=Nocardia terpenica TaxID=455432 RepID=A0A6G9Z6G4_9NOCA|nr:polyprenyl synthetase family protein [Nocardia terpenica]